MIADQLELFEDPREKPRNEIGQRIGRQMNRTMYFGMPQGEHATDAVEREIDEMLSEGDGDMDGDY